MPLLPKNLYLAAAYARRDYAQELPKTSSE